MQLGWFHITVAAACRGREVFASMRGGRFAPTPLGRIAERQWRALCARHAEALVCHAFQIMPDHAHALVHVRAIPARPLPIVAAWKAATTACARRELGLAPGSALWEDGCDIERKTTPEAVARTRLYVEDNPGAAREKRAAKARWGAARPLSHLRLPAVWPGAAPGEPPPAWSAFGNEALLDAARLVPLSVSRRASEEELREVGARMRALAREGAVLVISAISGRAACARRHASRGRERHPHRVSPGGPLLQTAFPAPLGSPRGPSSCPLSAFRARSPPGLSLRGPQRLRPLHRSLAHPPPRPPCARTRGPAARRAVGFAVDLVVSAARPRMGPAASERPQAGGAAGPPARPRGRMNKATSIQGNRLAGVRSAPVGARPRPDERARRSR